jgi:uncharacterized protein (TIGR02145 family)
MKVVMLLTLLCIAAFAQQKGTFTDTRDGKKYKITKIGEQVWMAENLNYDVKGSKCYNDSISYCGKYGRLYNWATAMKVCPKGWHLPSNAEWDKLIRHVEVDKACDDCADKYLKSTSGWQQRWSSSGNGQDTYGFSVLPGGYGISDEKFLDVGLVGDYWSSSNEDGSDYAYPKYMFGSEGIYNVYGGKGYLYSVRCVGD